jgi:hypothetical protein
MNGLPHMIMTPPNNMFTSSGVRSVGAGSSLSDTSSGHHSFHDHHSSGGGHFHKSQAQQHHSNFGRTLYTLPKIKHSHSHGHGQGHGHGHGHKKRKSVPLAVAGESIFTMADPFNIQQIDEDGEHCEHHSH